MNDIVMLAQFLDGETAYRALLALAIGAAGFGLYWTASRLLLRRAQRRVERSGLPFTPIGKPAILYFTTPECAPCKTIQRPALNRLQESLGDRLQVIEINAQECPDLASQYGVLSVPTTFIIDSGGSLRHVNRGVARAEILLRQVKSVL